jgi:hypothetical protein
MTSRSTALHNMQQLKRVQQPRHSGMATEQSRIEQD